MNNEQITSHLWELQNSRPEWEAGILSIDVSYKILNHALSKFYLARSDESIDGPILTYGYAKLIIIEAWSIRSNLCYTLNASTAFIDANWPNLKTFRDGLAHLDERVQGNIRVKGKKVKLKEHVKSFAGGRITTKDGRTWEIKHAKRLFNFSVSGVGIITPLGMVDDYILTNTDCGIEEIRLNKGILDALDKDILALK